MVSAAKRISPTLFPYCSVNQSNRHQGAMSRRWTRLWPPYDAHSEPNPTPRLVSSYTL